MKSAYELALERLESQGIERPDAAKLGEDVKARMAEIRAKAEAELAQTEILHRQRRAKVASPGEQEKEDEEYAIDRRRIEDQRDRKLAELRGEV
ncbi:MAG: hypothetical protein MPN21_08050 [Thermoanaerobaculia bacterium]|nr:hypothetical protein [Thermoanaerobaculia bacterium]